MRWLMLAMAAAAILLAFAGWPMLRVHLQSVAVLDLVGDKPVPAWLRRFVSEPIEVRDLQLPLASGTVRARLYTPLAPGMRNRRMRRRLWCCMACITWGSTSRGWRTLRRRWRRAACRC